MKKRLKFSIVVGIALVLLAIAGVVGGSKFLHAASALPGSNCTASGEAIVNVTIARGTITTSLDSISPGICFRFLIQNKDHQAYDFLFKQPGGNTVLAASTNIAPGQTASLDYVFADAPSGTVVNLVYTPTGQQNALATYQIYLAR